MPSSVSIIVPCYNEEKRIRFLLDAIFAQTYPRTQMSVTVADGRSTDRTREVIADFELAHAWRVFTRELFETCFQAGYLVTDFIYDTSGERPRSLYVLTHGESTLGDLTIGK